MEAGDIRQFSEMRSQQGKTLLVINNYKFRKQNRKLAAGETKWRCCNVKCCAYVKTLGTSYDRIITNINQCHTHEPEQEDILKRQILSYSMKRKVKCSISEKPSEIIKRELKTLSVKINPMKVKDSARPCKTMHEFQESIEKPSASKNQDFLLLNDRLNIIKLIRQQKKNVYIFLNQFALFYTILVAETVFGINFFDHP